MMTPCMTIMMSMPMHQSCIYGLVKGTTNSCIKFCGPSTFAREHDTNNVMTRFGENPLLSPLFTNAIVVNIHLFFLQPQTSERTQKANRSRIETTHQLCTRLLQPVQFFPIPEFFPK